MASSGWQTWNNLSTSSFGYDYFKCSIRVDSIVHNGDSITISGAYGVLNNGGYSSYYYYPINAAISGLGYSQVVAGQRWIGTNETVAVGFTTTVNAPAAATSANVTVEWSYNNGTAYNAYTYTLSFDQSVSAPTGLSVSSIQRSTESFTANVSISGWGVGSGSRYRELQCWTASDSGLVEPRRYQPVFSDATSGNITVSNSSSGSLTITPNTMYTLGAYASNGSANTGSIRVGNYTTLPPTPTISNIATTASSADFTYSVPNQGGKYNMTLKYQLNSGSNVTVTTLSGSGTKAGTFTISNLSPGTTYTVTAALSTSAGEVVSNTVTFTTENVSITTKFYGSAKTFAGISSCDIENVPSGFQPVVESVNSTAFKNWLNTQKRLLDELSEGKEIDKFLMYVHHYNQQYRFLNTVYFTDGTTLGFLMIAEATMEDLVSTVYSTIGVRLYSTLTEVTQASLVIPNGITYNNTAQLIEKLYGSVDGVTKEITKLYGSVNGVTKLIYQSST